MLINQIPLLIAVATMHLYKAIMLEFISFIHVYQKLHINVKQLVLSLKYILVSACHHGQSCFCLIALI